jgi:hypothetical protein
MKKILFLVTIFLTGCGTSPGKLKKLTSNKITYQNTRTAVTLSEPTEKKIAVQYLGCGGLYLVKNGEGILIDPFFSNQKIGRLGASFIGGGIRGRKKLSSNQSMISEGMRRMENDLGKTQGNVKAIFTAHSHYDHLMDVPIVFKRLEQSPMVYLNQSGFNTCYNVVDTSKMKVLEKNMMTREVSRPPIELTTASGKIQVYPILAEHNPHFKYIKAYSGAHTKPIEDFDSLNNKTRGNDWLEGNTFSFLIDYLDEAGRIDLRIFVQSSSCNSPAGIPPLSLLNGRPVDLAFLGVASYHFSPDYPCALLDSIKPKEVVWIHWEDFFRKYTKKPKTVRGTDVVKFFDIPCVKPYKEKALLPWPGVTYDVTY